MVRELCLYSEDLLEPMSLGQFSKRAQSRALHILVSLILILTIGWNWRAYLAYVIGIIPNFYGFLNNMGVSAPLGVTKAYYFAYPIGLFVSFFVYWASCWISPPALKFSLNEWHEPKDYIRPEERGEVVEGRVGDVESESISDGIAEKRKGDKGINITSKRSVNF